MHTSSLKTRSFREMSSNFTNVMWVFFKKKECFWIIFPWLFYFCSSFFFPTVSRCTVYLITCLRECIIYNRIFAGVWWHECIFVVIWWYELECLKVFVFWSLSVRMCVQCTSTFKPKSHLKLNHRLNCIIAKVIYAYASLLCMLSRKAHTNDRL